MLGPKYEGKRVRHLGLSFGTAASTSVTAPGTGLLIVPIYFHLTASVANASAHIYNGTSGTLLYAFKTAAGGTDIGWLWDDTQTSNKALVLETVGNIGAGEFHVWYIVRRTGAGDSGTGL